MNRLVTLLTLAMLFVTAMSWLIFGVFQARGLQQVQRDVMRVLDDRPPPHRRDDDDWRGNRPERRNDEFREWGKAVRGEVVSATLSQIRKANLWGFAVAALVCFGLAFWIAKTIANPLQQVSVGAKQVAQGDLQVRIPEPRSAPQETRDLVNSFNQMAENLLHADTARKMLFADVAHELRTPITAMQARLESIQDGFVPMDTAQLDRLYSQTQHLKRLVEDVRTLSLADAGQITLHRRDVNMAAFLDDVVQQYTPMLHAKNLSWRLDIARDLPTLSLDSGRMLQVFSNLLDNALKATESGWLGITAYTESAKVHVEISDSGQGLSNEALEHVFDRFYKSDTAGKGGSGLGLAIVQKLVELHGGSISAHRHPEGGAMFKVTLA